jgi:hypothetical protein
MSNFKDKSGLPPISQLRKDMGKFQENVGRKVNSSYRKMNVKTSTGPLLSQPTQSNKKGDKGAYILLGLIILVAVLFVFMLISIFIGAKQEEL